MVGQETAGAAQFRLVADLPVLHPGHGGRTALEQPRFYAPAADRVVHAQVFTGEAGFIPLPVALKDVVGVADPVGGEPLAVHGLADEHPGILGIGPVPEAAAEDVGGDQRSRLVSGRLLQKLQRRVSTAPGRRTPARSAIEVPPVVAVGIEPAGDAPGHRADGPIPDHAPLVATDRTERALAADPGAERCTPIGIDDRDRPGREPRCAFAPCRGVVAGRIPEGPGLERVVCVGQQAGHRCGAPTLPALPPRAGVERAVGLHQHPPADARRDHDRVEIGSAVGRVDSDAHRVGPQGRYDWRPRGFAGHRRRSGDNVKGGLTVDPAHGVRGVGRPGVGIVHHRVVRPGGLGGECPAHGPRAAARRCIARIA